MTPRAALGAIAVQPRLLKWKWKVIAQRIVTLTVCHLPREFCYRIARYAGTTMSLLPSGRRSALTANIAIARGLGTDAPVVRTDVRRAFQHAVLNYVDLFRLARPDARNVVGAISVDNWELFDEANARGKGVILVSAHLGNFDMLVQKLPMRGVKTLIPVQPVEPPELLDAIRAHRATLGSDVVPVGVDTFKVLAAHVRDGGTTVIVCDRDIQGTGYETALFGHAAFLSQAAVVLALRTGATLLGAFGYRHADNSITGRFVRIEGPWADSAPHGGRISQVRQPFRVELEAGMRAIAAMFEREIRRDPGQWVVQQPIFAPAEFRGHGCGSKRKRLRDLLRTPKSLVRSLGSEH